MSVFAPQVRVECGDALELLRREPEESVDCCVTSPPYFGLRSYLPAHHPDKALEIGTEATPAEYVARMVEVFGEVRRVLAPPATLWLNLGDSYANDGKWGGATGGKHVVALHGSTGVGRRRRHTSLKPKDLIGIPWMVAFALRADGWWLRSCIIWAKPNPMPESVTDRPTQAHEYVFLLTKAERYWYDAAAIAEAIATDCYHGSSFTRGKTLEARDGGGGRVSRRERIPPSLRNARSVWTIPTDPFPGAHFAVMPEELVRRCILAGCPEGGTVLDPFGGSGTVGAVAARHNRNAILFDLNPAYCDMARRRVWPEVQPRLALGAGGGGDA